MRNPPGFYFLKIFSNPVFRFYFFQILANPGFNIPQKFWALRAHHFDGFTPENREKTEIFWTLRAQMNPKFRALRAQGFNFSNLLTNLGPQVLFFPGNLQIFTTRVLAGRLILIGR